MFVRWSIIRAMFVAAPVAHVTRPVCVSRRTDHSVCASDVSSHSAAVRTVPSCSTGLILLEQFMHKTANGSDADRVAYELVASCQCQVLW